MAEEWSPKSGHSLEEWTPKSGSTIKTSNLDAKKIAANTALGLGGVVAIGGAAVGIPKGLNWLNAPKQMIKGIEQAYNPLRQQNPILGNVSLETAPELLGNQIKAQGLPIDQQTAAIKSQYGIGQAKLESDVSKLQLGKAQLKEQFRKGENVLGQRLKVLDDTLISGSTDDIVQTITKDAPKFFKSAYEAYGTGIDVAEEFMDKKGMKFTWTKFGKEVLDGIDENVVSKTLETAGKATDLTIRNAKAIVKSLWDNPALSQTEKYRVFERYAKFLENNAPPESVGMLKQINNQYRTVVKLRESLGTMKGGTYNTQRLYTTVRDYLTGNMKKSQESVDSLLKELSEGTGLPKPIEGLKTKVESGKLLKTERADVSSDIVKNREIGKGAISEKEYQILRRKNAITQAESNKQIRLGKVEKLKGEVDKLVQLKNKVEELVIKKDDILRKYPLRSGGGLKAVGGALKGLGRLGRGALGIVPQVFQAASMAGEFDKWRQQGGFMATDPMGGSEQIDPRDIEKMMKYGLIG